MYDLSGERGLGRAIALRLAEEGADVSDSLQVDDMVRQALEWFGQIDILVNNAGPWPACQSASLVDLTWIRNLS